MNQILIIAENELIAGIRNRWTHIFAAIFAILVSGISYFGLSVSGYSGVMQDFSRTTLSLLNLVLYLVPLMSLVIGVLSFSSDTRINELIYSQPVNRCEVFIGKFIGLAFVIFSATSFGFGISGIFILTKVGSEGMFRFLIFVLLSNLLGLAFIGVSALISSIIRQRNRAFGVSIFVWFIFLILYDLIIIGVTTLMRGRTAGIFAMISLFGNPVDIVRVSSLITLNSPEIFGPAGAAFVRFFGGEKAAIFILFLDLIIWIAGTVLISIKIFSRRDIN
jgi:Cu-processing system permease protein